MESQMESIDVSSIKAAALRLIELPQVDSEDPSRDDHLKAIQAAFHRPVAATNLSRSQATHQHQDGTTSQPVNTSESLPYLHSTVPDSQAIANVEQILEELPDASYEEAINALKKMSSQDAPHDTQPLSQAHFDSIKSKLQSRRLEVYEEETALTNKTLYPGDVGYVDFSSVPADGSIPQDGIVVDDEDESEPVEVDFSPTQSVPNRLPEFPESQRFKTPATVGKKRTYNGEVIESPALPRNPLVRTGEPTPGRIMGLSQAFGMTQAASSPFLNALPSELRSDRPSPAFAIQPRPNTATDSSPTLARPLIPRSSTEPQTKYISMAESQAIREARKRVEAGGGDVEEDAEEEEYDSFVEKARRLRARKQLDDQARKEFAAFDNFERAHASNGKAQTNSRKTGRPFSSPIRSSRVPRISSSPIPLPLNELLHPHATSPLDPPEGTPNASEEETDQEDEDEVAVRHSSQMRLRAVPEEDKENAPRGAIQIPETTALHRVMNGYAAEVQASPSVRHGNQAVRSHPGSQRPDDGEPFVVANSQSSQVRRYVINGIKLVSSGEQTDFVPQSQYPSESIPEDRFGVLAQETVQSPPPQDMPIKPSLLVSKSDTRSNVAEIAEEPQPVAENNDEDEDKELTRRNSRSRAAPPMLSSTIPETTSARLRAGISSSTDQRGEASKSMSEFETAPTHPPASSNDHDSAPAILPSQVPGLLSPVRTKRKRMTDIDAEESQTRSSGPDLGELSPMLIDREYSEIMDDSSPIRPGRFAKKRRLAKSPLKPRQQVSSSPIAASADDKHHATTGNDTADAQEPQTTQGETPPASSDDVLAAGPRSRGLHRPNMSDSGVGIKPVGTYGKTRSKPSAWDIQASPEGPAVTRKRPRITSLRNPSSTFPLAEVRPASTSRLSRATTQRLRASDDQDMTPVTINTRQSRAKSRPRDTKISAYTPEVQETLSTHNDHSPPPGEAIAQNQVLACYNGKARAYYPATCLGVSGAETLRYQIQWDGYEPDEIDEHGVRSLDLRHGDSIKINLEGFPKTPHVIRGFRDRINSGGNAVTDIRGYKTLIVVPKQRKSLPVDASIGPEEIKEVPVSAIYLDSNMWNQMKDRSFTYIPLPTLASSTRHGFSTPVDRPSTPSTPSSRSRRNITTTSTALPPTATVATGNGMFTNMAFAISYDSPIRKSELSSLITSNGGLVLTSGFHELFQPDSLILKPQYANLGFTALVADKHSRKEKYLQALALGLPCLSGKWLEANAARQSFVDWQSYLLPAGESDELEGAIRSRVLPSYDPAVVSAADLIDARAHILHNNAVVFVLGRGKAEEKRRPYIFLMQALGAGHVEKVMDLRAAKVLLDGQDEDRMQYKWVFVDDRDVETGRGLLKGRTGRGKVNVVGNEFVKQSLVLGRMFGGLIDSSDCWKMQDRELGI